MKSIQVNKIIGETNWKDFKLVIVPIDQYKTVQMMLIQSNQKHKWEPLSLHLCLVVCQPAS